MIKWSIAMTLCVALAGCASAPPPEYPICSVQPGTYACQVDQYNRVNE
ncbi:conserved exported hypothetical protein [Burkholderiales bacterium 8X]|nr:conserved exported hypothetical protein [Burkholderiales bacterium 8X]